MTNTSSPLEENISTFWTFFCRRG